MIFVPVILVLILFAAFFAATEIAVTMASRVRLRTRAERGVPGARTAERLLERPERAIITCLVGATLVNVGIAAYARAAVLAQFPQLESVADLLAAVVVVPLTLVFGELLPKALAQTYPNRTLTATAVPLSIVRWVLAPLLFASLWIGEVVRRVARLRPDLLDFLSREELKQFVAHSERHGHVDRDELELIHRIFEFWKLDPRRFLRPLCSVPRLSAQTPAREAKELMRDKHLVRLPVTDALDLDVVGVVSASGLLEAPNDAPIERYMQPAVRTQLSQGIDRLLLDLQRSPSQIAVVPGRTPDETGIIVLDDMLQHLLGRGLESATEAAASGVTSLRS